MITIENLLSLKHQIFFDKTLVLSIICSKCCIDNDKIFKEEESLETLKILGLLDNINL